MKNDGQGTRMTTNGNEGWKGRYEKALKVKAEGYLSEDDVILTATALEYQNPHRAVC